MSDDDFPHDDFPKLDNELLEREPNDEDNPYFIIEHILACRDKGEDYWQEWHDWYIDDLLRAFFKEEDKKSNYNKFGIYTPNESRTGDHFRWKEYHRLFQIKSVLLGVRDKLEQKGIKPTVKNGIFETLSKLFDWDIGKIQDFHYKGKLPPKRTPQEKRKIKRTLIKKKKTDNK